jgi:hypothetical protein
MMTTDGFAIRLTQPASASGAIHKVMLPRRRRPVSCSAQFVTLNFIFGVMAAGGVGFVRHAESINLLSIPAA